MLHSELVTTTPSDTPNTGEYRDEDFMLPADNSGEREVPEADHIMTAFSEEMKRMGIETKVLDREDNPFPDFLTSLTLTNGEQLSAEPTVRLYRGIGTQNGNEIAHQVGYLLKKPIMDKSGWHIVSTELESPAVFEAVARFKENPSYRAMVDMVNATDMVDYNREFVASRIRHIQLSLLQYPDRTLMDELEFQHVSSPGGAPSQDLSPFVATSTRADFAARYGDKLMVLDVPISYVVGSGETAEVLVVGEIKPEWITAVARFNMKKDVGHPSQAEVMTLIKTLGPTIETFSRESIRELSVIHRLSTKNKSEDVLEANKDLIKGLIAPLKEADELEKMFATSNVTTYKEALWVTADYYIGARELLNGRKFSHAHSLCRHDETDLLPTTPDFDSISSAEYDEESDQVVIEDRKPDLPILTAEFVQHYAQRYYRESMRSLRYTP